MVTVAREADQEMDTLECANPKDGCQSNHFQ